MNVALIGWNGMKNVGDDAMTLAIVDTLSARTNLSSLYIVGINDSEGVQYLNKYKPNFKVKFPPLYSLFSKIPGVGGVYHRWFLALKIVLSNQLIIIGGGTIFHSIGTNQFYNNLIKINRLLKLGRKIVSIGVSTGPFKDQNAESAFKSIIDGLDYISVRDHRSLNYCKSIKTETVVNYAPDLALCIPLLKKIDYSKKNEIGIILRRGHVSNEITKYLSKLIEQVSVTHADLTFIFHCFCELNDENENDLLAVNELLDVLNAKLKFKYEIHRYVSDPEHFYKRIAEAKLNICMRLHGSIISYAMETPFMMLSYHKKCDDFFTDMNIDSRFLIKKFTSIDSSVALVNEVISTEFKTSPVDSARSDSLNHFDFLDQKQ